MPFAEDIKHLANRISGLKERLQNNEEATKTALVLPFFAALGYDFTNLDDVEPEFDASWADLKGWKADYALMSAGKPVVIVECKPVSNNLERVTPQLGKYFYSTEASVGLVTNGILYKFYTDQDKENVMDDHPFWVLDLESLSDLDLEQLAKFAKGEDLTQAVEAASALTYISSIRNRLASQLENPDDGFVDLFGRELHSSGNYTQQIRERFRPLVQTAFQEFIRDQIIRGAGRAAESITHRAPISPEAETATEDLLDVADPEELNVGPEHQPTPEELEGYEIVKTIIGNVFDGDQVTIRDAQQYCAILWDNNNRRPLCRLHFNRSQKYIGLFDGTRAESGALIENRYPIETVQEISKFETELVETARRYQSE
ncbi:MAG: type I restriction enzyme HsdR N-terminal domain-containing protein [Chloroflexi bacterium]|nr:type I restriction enzyme HsdR N-terminal domain-containing protein [Chloroflexota bacterium]